MRNRTFNITLLLQIMLIFSLAWMTACQGSPPATPLDVPASPTPQPAPTPFVRRVVVDINTRRQTIAQVGSGDFIHRFGGVQSATDPISEMNLEVFQPRYARVEINLFSWEPVNDNEDPRSLDPAGFKDAGYNHSTFQFMQRLKESGVEITASIWEVPDWMVEDPSADTARVIPPGLYPEAVESIAEWLLQAREMYGVEVDYVSFNEANLGINILLSPQDVIALLKTAGPRFAELGLKTKWLLGDCSNIKDCLDYVKPIWAEENIRPYLGPLAYHSWDVLSLSDGTIAALGDFALENNLEARCTETGWDAALWQRTDEFPGWTNARKLASAYSRVIKLGRATALYYWDMMGTDYNLNNGTQAYPAMEMIRQINTRIPPGSQVVSTSPNAPGFASLAAETPQGLVVLLVNESTQEQVRLTGLRDGTYTQVNNTKDQLDQVVNTFQVTNGTAEFTLPGFSAAWLIEVKE